MPVAVDRITVSRSIVLSVGGHEWSLSQDAAFDLCQNLCDALGVRLVVPGSEQDEDPAPPEPVAASPPEPALDPQRQRAIDVFRRVSQTRPDWYAVASASGQSGLRAADVRQTLADAGIEVATRKRAGEPQRGPIPEPITEEKVVATFNHYVEAGAAPAQAIKFTQQGLRRRNSPTLLAEEIRQALRNAGIEPPEALNRGGYRAHKKDAKTRAHTPIAERVVEKYRTKVDAGEPPQKAIAACIGLTVPEPERKDHHRGVRAHEVRTILQAAGIDPSVAPPAPAPPAYQPKPVARPQVHEAKFESIWADVKKIVEFNVAKHGKALTAQEREDVVSECRIRLWNNVETLDRSKGVKAYAALVAQGACRDYRLKKSRRVQYVSDEVELPSGGLASRTERVAHDGPSPFDELCDEMPDEARQIREAAEGLPEKLQAAILMRMDGETFGAIGVRLGVSESRAYQYVTKATATLRDIIAA